MSDLQESREHTLTETKLPGGVVKYASQITRELGLQNLRDNPVFRSELSACISRSEHAAVFFEMPPISNSLKSSPFEFVLVPAPSLESVKTDFRTFAMHIEGKPEGCTGTVFANLGGDATLVVPCHRKDTPTNSYSHLSAFVRGAQIDQVDAFWQLLATSALERVGDRPLWISTSGMGVYYLHARLDSSPKYYNWKAYTDIVSIPSSSLGAAGAAATGKLPSLLDDPSSLVGLSEAEATRRIEEQGLTARVVVRDDLPLPTTRDLRRDRLNLEISSGRVKSSPKVY